MALNLSIPPCIYEPPHANHPPLPHKPLRINIQGPLETIQKLLPNTVWHPLKSFPQPAGQILANLTHQALYQEDDACTIECNVPIRYEYLSWVMDGQRPLE
jgi:hypothetical protein